MVVVYKHEMRYILVGCYALWVSRSYACVSMCTQKLELTITLWYVQCLSQTNIEIRPLRQLGGLAPTCLIALHHQQFGV